MRVALRASLRAFAHHPTLPITVVALFALGVGFAGGFWAAVDATLLRPLPFPEAGELVAVREAHPDRGEMAVTPASFNDWAGAMPAFAAVGGAYAVDVSFASTGLPERLAGSLVTEGFFDAWQVAPALGRHLQPSDFVAGDAVVIGHRVWQTHYAGRSDVLGAVARIDGRPSTVVGVMPADFRLPGGGQLWMPWMMSSEERAERRFHLIGVIARLANAGQAARAERDLEVVYAGLRTTHPELDGWRPIVRPLRAELVGDVSRSLVLVTASVGCLLAVGWVNLVALLAGAWPARRHEVMLRMALGASVRQVVAQFIVEIAVWAFAGSLLGLGIARVVIAVFASWLLGDLLFAFRPAIDARLIAAISAGLTVTLAAIAIGPLLAFVRRESDLTPRRHRPTGARLRFATGILQGAGSVVLLGLASSLVTGLGRLEAVAGPDSPRPRIAMNVTLSELEPADQARQRQFFDRLREALAARPEIAAVGMASYVPPTPPLGTARFEVVGRAASPIEQAAVAGAVDAGAFALLDLPVVKGRGIDNRDGPGGPQVAVVSEAFVRRYFPGEDALGQQLRVAGVAAPLTIVGIVADARQPLASDSRIEAVLYLSYRQVPWPFMTLLVEPRGDPASAGQLIRQEVARLAPDQATGDQSDLRVLRTAWLVPVRSRAWLVILFGATAGLLTLVGLYGGVTRDVASRVREFAIRQALGATPGQVTASLALRGVAATAAGAAIGAAVLLPTATRLLGQTADLPGVEPTSLAAVVVVMTAVSLVCAYLPARRAAHAAPRDALQSE